MKKVLVRTQGSRMQNINQKYGTNIIILTKLIKLLKWNIKHSKVKITTRVFFNKVKKCGRSFDLGEYDTDHPM